MAGETMANPTPMFETRIQGSSHVAGNEKISSSESVDCLHSAAEFLKDAVTNGILVPLPVTGDTTSTTGQSLRKLELAAAVEFMRLYDHLLNRGPRTRESARAQEQVGELVSGWVRRALTDGWTVHRIEERCPLLRGERHNGVSSESTEPKPALDVSSGRIIVDRKRLSALTQEEREALAQRLLALICEAVEYRVHVDVPVAPGDTQRWHAGCSSSGRT
jgi:hypothetical protein